MTKGAKSRTNHKPSINYRYNPHGGPVFDLIDDYAPSSQTNSKQPPNQPDVRSSILSTSDLISGVSQLWNFATSSIPVVRHKTSTQNNDGIQKEKTFYYVGSISSEGQNVSVNLKADNHVSPTVNVQKNLDFLHVTDKLRLFNYKEKSVPSVMISYEVQNIYKWMNTIQISRPPECYKEKTDYHDAETNNVERKAPENQESSLQEYTKGDNNCSDMTSYLGSENVQDDGLNETNEGQNSHFVNQEVSVVSSVPNKQQYVLAKQEHAFAGAFAGVFVSLCLHPMDTVKTVVQSCHTDHRSIQYIGKSIISERGLSGLYRGITSNIASSAPISAIYTFSYESVKAALLPLFAKEYQSLAHCVAGGCASVATSFVFTPSERIKQQMQVGSHYNTCWNALLGIVGKGGVLSLYNGWGAVLCRNVPHSIIKFYTYESLKNVMLTSHQPHAQPTTISTLLCGGLAGSTAAFFTTPFDVVKTRLQTQIPGSANRYDGVYNTLRDIAQHEGLKGLYRGLSPRLAMYMTQGALFFASYESFKRLFSLEANKLESPTTGL